MCYKILTFLFTFFYFIHLDIWLTEWILVKLWGKNVIWSPYVSAFLGADINVVDATRGKDIREWAVKTGRFETLHKLRRLNSRPQAKQFCEKYVPEWPDLKDLVAKATATKSTGQKVAHRLKSTFTFNFPHDPQDNGFMDHMVRITTSIHSPLVVTGCRPLCPSSPPEIGKRRLAVPELMQMHPGKKLEEHVMRYNNGSISVASTSVSSVSAELVLLRLGAERQRALHGLQWSSQVCPAKHGPP